jgi:hypothetical protein
VDMNAFTLNRQEHAGVSSGVTWFAWGALRCGNEALDGLKLEVR